MKNEPKRSQFFWPGAGSITLLESVAFAVQYGFCKLGSFVYTGCSPRAYFRSKLDTAEAVIGAIELLLEAGFGTVRELDGTA
jgi:hypothetical protein